MLILLFLVALKQMYSSGTQSLCQRLEQRIESLSQLGSHLQAENKGKILITISFPTAINFPIAENSQPMFVCVILRLHSCFENTVGYYNFVHSEMAAMMEDQDEKLKRVKQHEKILSKGTKR